MNVSAKEAAQILLSHPWDFIHRNLIKKNYDGNFDIMSDYDLHGHLNDIGYLRQLSTRNPSKFEVQETRIRRVTKALEDRSNSERLKLVQSYMFWELNDRHLRNIVRPVNQILFARHNPILYVQMIVNNDADRVHKKALLLVRGKLGKAPTDLKKYFADWLHDEWPPENKG